MRIFISFSLFLVCLVSFAERPLMHDLELGMTFGQRARVLKGAEVAWADYELLKIRYKPLRRFNIQQINEILLTSYAYLTDLQFNYVDMFMEVKGEVMAYRPVFHPQGYIRGSVSSLLLPGQIAETGMYPVDLKGTGISPEGEVRLFTLKEMYLALKGEQTHILNFDNQGSLEHIQEGLDRLKKRKEETEKKLQAADLLAEQIRGHQHSLHQVNLEIEAYQFFLDNIKKTGTADRRNRRAKTFLNMLRRLDYTHGLMPLDRSMKEVIMQRAMQRLFDSHAEDLGTVETYFVIALPVYILGPNGEKVRASVIGRRPHLRSHSKKAHDEYVKQLPPTIIQPVLAGGLQFAVGGRVVDFELPSIHDPELPELAYDPAKGHPIEAITLKAAKAFNAGDKLACFDVVNNVLAPLDRRIFVAKNLNQFSAYSEQWEGFSRNPQYPDNALFQAYQDDLKKLFPDPEKLISLMMPLLDSRPELLGRIIVSEINTFLEKNPPKETPEYFSKANEALYHLVDPVYSLVQLAMGDPRYSAILVQIMDAYSKFPKYHMQLIQEIGPELLRTQLVQVTTPGMAFQGEADEEKEGWSKTFVKGTAMYNLSATAINTVSITLLRMKDHKGPVQPEEFKITINMGDKSTPLSSLMKIFAQDAQLFRAIIKVAEGLTGLTTPPALHEYLLSEATAEHRQRIEQEIAVETMVRQMTAGACAQNLTMEGVEALMKQVAGNLGIEIKIKP